MRVALKIAYDGRAFFGHQRQPDARTVEGECLVALRAAGIFQEPRDAFFRSASRTDRGVSAVGNVIAFNTTFRPEAVVGAFNDRARDVWAWAVATVPDSFHPRHAVQRWYRYHLFLRESLSRLRAAAALFVGSHDFRSFTSDREAGRMTVDRIEVNSSSGATLIDVYGRSFRRGMVRRIVAAMLGVARGEIDETEVRVALAGRRRDFGAVAPEPLFLMDVRYPFSMSIVLKPKVLDEWRIRMEDTALRSQLDEALRGIVRSNLGPESTTHSSMCDRPRTSDLIDSGVEHVST